MQLPASFFAYRKQQHRWTCGPVQLWRKAAVDIWASSLPLYHKLDLIFCYFGIRKVATHWVSMGFFCGLVPLSVFTPEVPIKDPCAHRFPPLPHQHLCWGAVHAGPSDDACVHVCEWCCQGISCTAGCPPQLAPLLLMCFHSMEAWEPSGL